MQRALRAIIIICMGFLVSSCAYVQTHKNVEEIGSYFEGEVLHAASMQLYKYHGTWYLSAQKALFKLHYPAIHDSVFQRNDYAPELKFIRYTSDHPIYHPISSNAARILQRPDGYFQLRALAEEIHRTPGVWEKVHPAAELFSIKSEIGGKQVFYIEDKRVPDKQLLSSKILGKVDLFLIDIPATVLYNVAIPFMAPFVFYYELSHDDY